MVNGLAWTSVGGEMLQVEVAVLDGTGKLSLTGSLGSDEGTAQAATTSGARVCDHLGLEPRIS